MSIRSRALLVALAVLLPSCAYVRLPGAGWSAAPGRPVALLVEGSAFNPTVRGLTAREVERQLDRPVRIVDALPTVADDDTKALAERVVGGRSLRYDWREPQCPWDRTLLTGVTHDVDAVYRAVVEYSEHERLATDAEWEELDADRIGFRRLTERPRVRQEFVTGTVTRTALVMKDAVARASLHRRRLTFASDRDRIDVAAAVAGVVRELGAAPDPEWEGLARRQLKQGCPFLALAIADTQLGPGAREPVETAALAAMRGNADRGRARDDAGTARRPAPTPPPAADAPRMAPEASEPAEMPGATAAASGASCQALCAMHMVEICNTDKVLWSAHRARWEPTPCGMRRGEPFLARCYQEQWDTGTFDTSCVQPCEASEAGRSRLTAILQESGCVADPGPS